MLSLTVFCLTADVFAPREHMGHCRINEDAGRRLTFAATAASCTKGEVSVRRVSRILDAALAIGLLALAAFPAAADDRLRMSTTTSTENSGLLAVLLPPFEGKYDCKVDVIAVGTGKSLKIGETGDVDVVFVHARSLEDKFVADGFGVDRYGKGAEN